jgi:hypothetical protein
VRGVPEPTQVAQPPETPKPPAKAPPKPEPKGKTTPKPKPKAKAKPKPKPKSKPKPRKADPKALALYRKAAQALQHRHYPEAKAALDDLKRQFPKSALHGDTKRKPSVPSMLKTIAARGPRIAVSRSGEGNVTSLSEAARAIEKPRSTVLIQSGNYAGGMTLLGELATGLVIRGVGERPPRLQGGSDAPSILRFPADSKDIWIERLELAKAERALFIGPRSSASLRDVMALQDVKMGLDKYPASPVTINRSLLKISGLSNATARASAFYCDETPIDHNRLTACIVAGPELAFYNMNLTDCLVLGRLTLLGRNRLNHVTIIGPIDVPEDATGNTITNSIVDGIKTWEPKADVKEKPPVHLTIKHTAFRRQTPRFHEDVVKMDKHVKKVAVEFASPATGDYRLIEDSHLRGEAADKTDPGCRFPPEMRELLERARRFPAILRPAGQR